MSIYVYCMNKETNEKWASKYTKVKAVVVQLDELISRIMTDHNIKKTIEGPLSTNRVTARAEAGKFDDVADDHPLKLAKNEIIRVLDLEEHETKDEIINDLLENGRQSLSKYKQEFAPKVYKAAMHENDGPLMKSLKKYFEQLWKIEYGSSNQWFILFLKEYKDTVHYDSVLKRTAEYGNKYSKDSPILSIVLQLTLESIDDKFFDEKNAFNDLWCAITSNGLKSIKDFSDKKKRLVLLQALCEYHRPKLFELLEKRKLDDVVDDEALKLAKHEIIRALDLEEHETKDEIINDLLENGLRSLSKYEEELLPYIYAAALNEKDGKLRKSLKKYIELQWKIKYGLSNQWFMKFLEDHKDTVNYNSVLNRTAIYGNKWLKDFPILSIVLQLLFEGIDDKFFDETNAFNDLWHTITDGGLKSIEKFSNYMDESTMLKLINKKQPVLFQALREYYRPKLFKLLEKSQIPDKDNFYEVALDSVAEYANAYKMQGKLDLIEYLGSFYPFDTKILLQ
ncbi:unnamed protein product [Rotaria sordida]|uniref:Uncharacterized protein n=1 Tax=Rotaria sordida TaxID=392033 RepID=A0A815C4E7_9BILA|nr:unnamed protein product [Rotaria sordida]